MMTAASTSVPSFACRAAHAPAQALHPQPRQRSGRRRAAWAAWLATSLAAAPTLADSIWNRADPGHAFLFVDSKARVVGDLITVVISENTNIANRDDRSMNKETSVSEGFKFAGAAGGGLGVQGATASLDAGNESSREFKGDASYNSARQFIDRVTVTVMDVLPNGNLVVSGKRRLQVAGEDVTLNVSGVIRGIDIGPDNSVQSRFISELRMTYENGGPPRHYTRQGFLGRVGNRVWPF